MPAPIAGTRMLPSGDGSGHLPLPIPVGRLGQPKDVADMVLAILINPYLTSKVIAVDGGIFWPDRAFARPRRPAGAP